MKEKNKKPMTKEEIFEYFEKSDIDVQNALASVLAIDLVFKRYGDIDFEGILFGPVFGSVTKNFNFYQITNYDKIKAVSKKVYEDYLKNKNSLDKLINEHRKLSKRFDEIWKEYNKKKDKLSREECVEYYDRFIDIAKKWWYYGVVGEDKGKYIEEVIVNLIQKNHNFDKSRTQEIANVLSHPDEGGILVHERIEFFQLCLMAMKDKKLSQAIIEKNMGLISKNKGFMKKFEEFRKKYFYKYATYHEIKELNIDTIIEEINKEISSLNIKELEKKIKDLKEEPIKIREEKKKILKEIKLSLEEKKAIYYAQKISHWFDLRKKWMMEQFYVITYIVKEMSKKYNIGYPDILYFGVDEIRDIISGKKELDKKELEKRYGTALYLFEKDKPTQIFYKEEALKMLQAARKIISKDEFRGVVASKGSHGNRITGKIKIIMNPLNEKFSEGEILVTSMTRIEFVPLMKKAKAIITDEGGIACHAAIISRELGLPCITTTKIGSSVLKDGDLIEMDMEKGIVKILERKA